MNILVMGAGAVGSVFGGFLAKAGHQVCLVGRERHMAAIRETGLQIEGIWGEHVVRNLGTSTTIGDVPPEPFDLVLITTKSYDTGEAARQVLPVITGKTLVVSLQNGLGNVDVISDIVGPHRVVGGTLIFGVEHVAEGRVKVTVFGGNVMLGSQGSEIDTSRIVKIADAFTEAGIPAEATREIQKFIWGKVLYNCCLNALSALLEVSYGRLSEFAEAREIIAVVIEEVFTVAKRQGVTLAWDSPSEYQRHLFGQLVPATYSHHASMLYDVRHGKRTEIDSLNGAITRLGTEMGLRTPVNQMLTRLVKAKEQMCRGEA